MAPKDESRQAGPRVPQVLLKAENAAYMKGELGSPPCWNACEIWGRQENEPLCIDQ